MKGDGDLRTVFAPAANCISASLFCVKRNTFQSFGTIGYLHRQWQRLILFVDDGNIEATNNRRERELRRLVLGRKNWLFTWLDLGAERTANILTIVATCIAHDVNPRAYLHLVTKLIVHGWPHAKLPSSPRDVASFGQRLSL